MNQRSKSEQSARVAQLLRDKASARYAPAPATENDLAAAGPALGCSFPESFQWFQREFGAYEGAFDVYPVKPVPEPGWNIAGIAMSERHECYPPMPVHLIPFSNNGGGDSYCLDTSQFTDGECPVVFWDHEGDAAQQPEVLAASFLDWLEQELTAEEDPGEAITIVSSSETWSI